MTQFTAGMGIIDMDIFHDTTVIRSCTALFLYSPSIHSSVPSESWAN